MSDKDMQKMKEFLEKKKHKESKHQKFIPDKKIGHAANKKSNIKTGGSNNKV